MVKKQKKDAVGKKQKNKEVKKKTTVRKPAIPVKKQTTVKKQKSDAKSVCVIMCVIVCFYQSTLIFRTIKQLVKVERRLQKVMVRHHISASSPLTFLPTPPMNICASKTIRCGV